MKARMSEELRDILHDLGQRKEFQRAVDKAAFFVEGVEVEIGGKKYRVRFVPVHT